VLEEASKLASEVLSPLNKPGEREGRAPLADGGRFWPPTAFAAAYQQFVNGGWKRAQW